MAFMRGSGTGRSEACSLFGLHVSEASNARLVGFVCYANALQRRGLAGSALRAFLQCL
jgi:hypothetical protein